VTGGAFKSRHSFKRPQWRDESGVISQHGTRIRSLLACTTQSISLINLSAYTTYLYRIY